jgi:hypothetical protein
MDMYTLPYNLRDAILCLTFLAGAAAGVLAITRQYKTTGILTLVGFLLLGIDPILEVLIFRVFMNNYMGENYGMFNWAYVCLSTPANLIGVGCLIAAVFVAIRPKPSEVDNSPIHAPDPDLTLTG